MKIIVIKKEKNGSTLSVENRDENLVITLTNGKNGLRYGMFITKKQANDLKEAIELLN